MDVWSSEGVSNCSRTATDCPDPCPVSFKGGVKMISSHHILVFKSNFRLLYRTVLLATALGHTKNNNFDPEPPAVGIIHCAWCLDRNAASHLGRGGCFFMLFSFVNLVTSSWLVTVGSGRDGESRLCGSWAWSCLQGPRKTKRKIWNCQDARPDDCGGPKGCRWEKSYYCSQRAHRWDTCRKIIRSMCTLVVTWAPTVALGILGAATVVVCK